MNGHTQFEPQQLRDFRADLLANPALAMEAEGACNSGLRTSSNSLRALKAGEFLSMDIKPRAMLLDPILPEQGLAMIHAKRGVGKTHVTLGVAVAVASGKSFLRWNAPHPRKVLFVDGELPASVLQSWLAEAVAAIGADDVSENLTIITPDLQDFGIPDLATFAGQAALAKPLESADLIILDNLSALVRAGNENEAESWLPLQGWALDLRRRSKSLIFVHHSGRSGNPRGTSKREDLLDTVIALRHPANYLASEGLRAELHFEKNRGFHGKGAEPFEIELRAGADAVGEWLTRDLEASQYDRAAALFAQGCNALAVKEELGISRATAFRYQSRYRGSQSQDSASTV
jgi:putative DNA primase/helicase